MRCRSFRPSRSRPAAEDCTNSGGKVASRARAEACGTLIDSGKLKGADIAWAFSNRCIARKALGEQDKALDDCDKAIELDGKDAVAFQARGLILLDKGDNDRALADFDKAVALGAKNAALFSDRGNLLLAKGESRQGDRRLQRGSGHRRQERLRLCRTRRRLARQGRFDRALAGLFQGDRTRAERFLRHFQSRRRL